MQDPSRGSYSLDELFDNIDCFIHSSDCLRSLTLTILSFGTLYLFVFIVVEYVNIILAGEYAYLSTFLCHISLTLGASFYALFTTPTLLILTWESSQIGNTNLLNGFMNRLILTICAFLIIGVVATPTAGVIPLVLFYAATIVIFDKLGNIKHAVAEVKRYESS